MVQALEGSDEDIQFTKFMELPPEMRLDIYTWYFESLGVLSPWPHQPPICLVSSQVRKESLPLFYSIPVFEIILQRGWASDITFGHNIEGPRNFIAHSTQKNLTRVTQIDVLYKNDHRVLTRWNIRASDGRRAKALPLFWRDPNRNGVSSGIQSVARKIDEALGAAVCDQAESLLESVLRAVSAKREEGVLLGGTSSQAQAMECIFGDWTRR